MAGGPGEINEYNQTLTPEERKANARKAARAPRPKSNIKRIAKMINAAPAGTDIQTALRMLGLTDVNVSNAAGIALAVYQAAVNGDMRAVEKWEKYNDQEDRPEKNTDGGVRIIDDM